MENNNDKDKRKELREDIIGDILWAYVSDAEGNLSEGAIIDLSQSGLCILTYKQLEEGSRLRLFCSGCWKGERYATVRWCRKIDTDTYRSGLHFSTH